MLTSPRHPYLPGCDRLRELRLRDAYGKLYPMDAEVWKFIGQYPKLKVAFLDDKNGDIVNKMSEDERGRFDAACQMMGGMFEYYLLMLC